MKKIMFMALMAAAATTTFAQDALVKEAKKVFSKNDFDAATQMLAPALTSAETVDKAAAWNLQSEIYYGKWNALSTIEVERKVKPSSEPYDTLGMHLAAVEAWKAVLKCDEFDQQPDAKGKVKLKYRSSAQTKYKVFGVPLVQAGQFLYQQKKNQNALEAWKLYLGMKDSPIYAEVKDFPKDPFYADILYYVAFLSYQEKAYADAEKYAKLLVAETPDKADEANEILLFSKKDNCKTKADSLEYLAQVKEMRKAEPDNERYFNLLLDYFNHVNDPALKAQWLEEEVQIDPNNKMVWAIKGENAMNDDKWDEAIEDFQKAIEVDPAFTACIFNCGRCYYAKAMALQDKLADKNGMITNENRSKVAEVVKDAEKFYVRTRELDPDREVCNWAYPLYQIYYFLKDEAKQKEIEAIDPSLAQ